MLKEVCNVVSHVQDISHVQPLQQVSVTGVVGTAQKEPRANLVKQEDDEEEEEEEEEEDGRSGEKKMMITTRNMK